MTTTTGGLAFDLIAESQSQKFQTHNDALQLMDNALTAMTSINVAAGDATITTTQARNNLGLLVINAPASPTRYINLPVLKRSYIIVFDSGTNSIPAKVKMGATEMTMIPGGTYIVYTDGSANGLTTVGFPSMNSAGALMSRTYVYDVGVFVAGKPSASEVVFHHTFRRAVTLPASFSGTTVLEGHTISHISGASARTAATATNGWTMQKNGTNITTGTLSFAAAATVCTFGAISATSFAVGDTFSLTGNATPDTTLADIAFTFAFIRGD